MRQLELGDKNSKSLLANVLDLEGDFILAPSSFPPNPGPGNSSYDTSSGAKQATTSAYLGSRSTGTGPGGSGYMTTTTPIYGGHEDPTTGGCHAPYSAPFLPRMSASAVSLSNSSSWDSMDEGERK